jgi:hypothetical protein
MSETAEPIYDKELMDLKDDLSNCITWTGYSFDPFLTAMKLYNMGYRKDKS